jgi:hypothetical protein
LVFKQFMPDMDCFRADLKAAGIQYVNDTGEYADFHSLRKTFATELAKAGVATRVAMELMRHSDPKLTTQIYTDAGMLPIWDAVGALPMFSDTQIGTHKLVGNSQSAPTPVLLDSNEKKSVAPEAEKVSPLLSQRVQNR